MQLLTNIPQHSLSQFTDSQVIKIFSREISERPTSFQIKLCNAVAAAFENISYIVKPGCVSFSFPCDNPVKLLVDTEQYIYIQDKKMKTISYFNIAGNITYLEGNYIIYAFSAYLLTKFLALNLSYEQIIVLSETNLKGVIKFLNQIKKSNCSTINVKELNAIIDELVTTFREFKKW